MGIIKLKGGLGNQMYQYALGVFLEKKYGIKFVYDKSSFEWNDFRKQELKKIFNLNLATISKTNALFYKGISVKIFGKRVNILMLYEKIFKKNPPFQWYVDDKKFKNMLVANSFCKQCYYNGYFQFYKHLQEVRKELLSDFAFTDFKSKKNISLAPIIKQTNSVSVHVRRTDYINNPDLGGIVGVEYYNKAIAMAMSKVNKAHFFVFSDDINWAKQHIDFKDSQVLFVDWNVGDRSFRDMQLMSLCKHNIIANSSFSWWGAWLNKNINKVIISPKKWLNEEADNIDDRIPSQWIKI